MPKPWFAVDVFELTVGVECKSQHTDLGAHVQWDTLCLRISSLTTDKEWIVVNVHML